MKWGRRKRRMHDRAGIAAAEQALDEARKTTRRVSELAADIRPGLAELALHRRDNHILDDVHAGKGHHMILTFIISMWIGALAAVATPIVYGLCNRWWENYWGRTLLFKDVIIGLAYTRSLFATIFNPKILITPFTAVITVAMAAGLTANLAVMVFITLRSRSRKSELT